MCLRVPPILLPSPSACGLWVRPGIHLPAGGVGRGPGGQAGSRAPSPRGSWASGLVSLSRGSPSRPCGLAQAQLPTSELESPLGTRTIN